MKITIYTLTTDGDNMGTETQVFVRERDAREHIIFVLKQDGMVLCQHEQASSDELCALWTKHFDGICTLERHELEVEGQP